MPAAQRKDPGPPRTKRCPVCDSENSLSSKNCSHCDYEFPQNPERLKPCPDCGGLNQMSAKDCVFCGTSFGTAFTLTLTEALRTGAIVHGMDLSESDVQASEQIADVFRERALQSGEEVLINLVTTWSEESFSKVVSFCSDFNNQNSTNNEDR